MKRTRIQFIVTLLLLLIANGYIFIHRNKGFKYYPYKTYNEIYTCDSSLYLKDIHFNPQSLQLITSIPFPADDYAVYCDDVFVAKAYPDNNSILIPLKDDIHSYSLIPNKEGLIIRVRADHSPIPKSPQQDNFDNEFTYCNLPGPFITPARLTKYTKGISLFSKDEIDYARQILNTKTKVYTLHSNYEMAKEIAKFCASLCNNSKNGLPFWKDKLSAKEQLEQSLQCKLELVCGNYTDIYHYLISVAGIPNRIVTYNGPCGNWQYGAHYMNEVFIKEKQQWVLIDLMSNIIMPHDNLGRFYNIVDIRKMVQTNSNNNMLSFTFANDSLKEVSYTTLNRFQTYYNQSNADIQFIYPDAHSRFPFLSRVWEFYSFKRNYVLYLDVNRNNWLRIVVKEAAILMLIITFLLYFVYEVEQLILKKRQLK